MANIEKLPLFVRCVIQNFPFIEEDFDALTNYELISKVVEFLNKVIKSQNEVIDVANNLQVAFQQLHDYIENYFDNLDVQEEINNKLDAMAESGQLTEIIGAYLQTTAVWSFDTVADMKTSQNLIDGSYARTLGFHSINDGGGGLYKISNTGTANEMDVIAVGELYATVINPKNVKQFGAYGDGETDDTAYIQRALDNLHEIYIPDGTYMIDVHASPSINSGLIVSSNTRITLSPNATLKAITNSYTNYNIFRINNVSDVEINGGNLIGDRDTHTGETGEWGHGIYITSSSNVKLININISEMWGDGITINNGSNILTNNLLINHVRRNGISISHVKNYHSLNDTIKNTVGTAPENGIDIEPDNSDQEISGVIIEGLLTENNAKSAVHIHLLNLSNTYPTDVTIINHKDKGSYTGFELQKDVAVYGSIVLSNPYYINNKMGGIYLTRCAYNAKCPVLIDKPVIINCNTNLSTAYATGATGITCYAPSDYTENVGGVTITEPYITTSLASANYTFAFNNAGSGIVKNITIIDPVYLDGKGVYYTEAENFIVNDKNNLLSVTYTSSGSLAKNKYYSSYNNIGSTANAILSIPSDAYIGTELKFTNMVIGKRLRVRVPADQYVLQLDDTNAAIVFNMEVQGDSVSIKKIDSTHWIVTEINCTPTLV